MLVVKEVDDGGPCVLIIDVVTKARRVDDGQLGLELLFLKFGLDDVDLGHVVELLMMATTVVLGRAQLGREESVDEGRLAQTGLAYREKLLRYLACQ